VGGKITGNIMTLDSTPVKKFLVKYIVAKGDDVTGIKTDSNGQATTSLMVTGESGQMKSLSNGDSGFVCTEPVMLSNDFFIGCTVDLTLISGFNAGSSVDFKIVVPLEFESDSAGAYVGMVEIDGGPTCSVFVPTGENPLSFQCAGLPPPVVCKASTVCDGNTYNANEVHIEFSDKGEGTVGVTVSKNPDSNPFVLEGICFKDPDYNNQLLNGVEVKNLVVPQKNYDKASPGDCTHLYGHGKIYNPCICTTGFYEDEDDDKCGNFKLKADCYRSRDFDKMDNYDHKKCKDVKASDEWPKWADAWDLCVVTQTDQVSHGDIVSEFSFDLLNISLEDLVDVSAYVRTEKGGSTYDGKDCTLIKCGDGTQPHAVKKHKMKMLWKAKNHQMKWKMGGVGKLGGWDKFFGKWDDSSKAGWWP